jgi:PAS domain S-box-containing protein
MTPGDREQTDPQAIDRQLTLASLQDQEGRLGRGWQFTQRFAAARAKQGAAESAPPSGTDELLVALADMAVPLFSDWCCVNVVEGDGDLRRLIVRHRGCVADRAEQPNGSCVASLVERVPQLTPMAKRVLANGRSEVWPNSDDQRPWCIVVGLWVNERPFATVTFAVDETHPGYELSEIVAAEEVSWGTANAIERFLLHRDAHDAIRQSQRIARQLHQLIAASMTVTGLENEQAILVSLAGSTRSVFDADTAIVSLESGSAAPLCGVARRGKKACSLGPGDDAEPDEFPASRAGTTATWLENGWLVAPILEERDHTRGVVAIRRETNAGFGAEEMEVLTLLAQIASRALSATELSRTIKQNEARWRVLVESAPVGIVEVDPDGGVRWWNRAAGKIFAWSSYSDSPINRVPEFPEAAVARLEVLWSDVLRGAFAGSRDFVDVEIGGRRRDLTASAVLLPSADGDARSILTLVDDVTDHRELKAELRHAHQMEIRGQVASSVAHDFNNLLTLISGYAEMLSQNLQSDDHSLQMVMDIQTTASRASSLTEQLQTIGRTKAPEPIVLSPVAAIQSNAEVIERIVGVDVEVVWSLDERAGNVRVDADQFEQMILNLALNARDAMPEGGRLSIAVDSTQVEGAQAAALNVEPGEFIRISIEDNGSGMDEETRLHCFDPLFTTKGPFEGTGLGLASARRLVEQSGGSISCRSELGVGTTFTILLPVVDEVASDDSPLAHAVRARGSATVLLAEDDEGLRRLMVQVLERNGYRVIEADSAERALELAERTDGIDLLVSDVVMGPLSGPELAVALQGANPALRVLMTSGSADETVIAGLSVGSAAFLAKPFKPSELIDRVHELLSRAEPRPKRAVPDAPTKSA